MAYRTQIFCPSCKQTKDKFVSAGHGYGTATFARGESLCGDCEAVQVEEERSAHFVELDSKTVEERIRLIEEWIYDYKPKHVPEPRF